MNAYNTLRNRLGWIHDLKASAAVLEWDQETYLPDGATALRAAQVATLHRLAHEAFTDAETGRLLDAAERQADPAEEAEGALIDVTRRDFERAQRLPAVFVAERAETVGLAKSAWRDARRHADFSRFEPLLSKIVALNRKEAELHGYADHPYSALLETYEPGTSTEDVRGVFANLQQRLVPLAQRIIRQTQPGEACLRRPFDESRQWGFGLQVLRDIGFDLSRGRLDRSAHPFTTTFGTRDVRLTTRVDPNYFPTAFFGTLHEAGHGLYEQGIDPGFDRTPLAEGTSLGMHESQARLWENLVGRSLSFWEGYFPLLQETFPEALGDVSLEAFHAALNRVEPSPIRVEADEVTYNLHILLRFELEVGLVEGALEVRDLPAAWNEGMERLLGFRPRNDAEGVLQDVHWALGTLGYFPTYTLGTLMSAMLFEAAERDLGPLDDHFRERSFTPLLSWLQTHVHRFGRARSARKILRDATGRDLEADTWLRHIETRFVQ